MAQLTLAWTLAEDVVFASAVGTTSLTKLAGLIAAVGIESSGDDVKHVEEPYRPMEITGH
ncbi:hypothetical protein FA95DRAFT_1606039 [Auriscalpium vulgare]|uniref:Uncharacterized protein n=1 Tax=Auriscalpium vulgare TaxID=40419 RepID=A0ACB8RT25_9AGAM|nr:hypothetical protein FA95DRAFT_1606039 [Auriscalpium vulgare]